MSVGEIKRQKARETPPSDAMPTALKMAQTKDFEEANGR